MFSLASLSFSANYRRKKFYNIGSRSYTQATRDVFNKTFFVVIVVVTDYSNIVSFSLVSYFWAGHGCARHLVNILIPTCCNLILCQKVLFFINLMVNYDQNVPKLYVNVNILMKKHQIWTAKISLWPHFMPKSAFSSSWLSIMIKMCLNFMLTSIFWWKNIKYGLQKSPYDLILCQKVLFHQVDCQLWSNFT